MTERNRRSVLAMGAAFAAGGMFASSGAGKSGLAAAAAETDALPDPTVDPNPEMADEDWASYRATAGHARNIEGGTGFDGESLEAIWSADHTGPVAIADGTVYTTTEDGVVALDAADGSLVWENTAVDADTPAVVGDTVYLTGEEVVALDRTDGSVRWETDFDPGDVDSIGGHTVAYGGVYVVVDGTLYALEADDGSVRWKIDSVTGESSSGSGEYEFAYTTAAANGVVYAVTGPRRDSEGVDLALDPETGHEVWRASGTGGGSQALATTVAVALSRVSYYARIIRDAQTGEHIEQPTTEYVRLALDEEIYIGGENTLEVRSLYGDEYNWEKDIMRDEVSVGEPVISEETVYIYFPWAFTEAADYSEELVALDKYDGTEKWVLSKDDAPVGEIRAISGETIYVDHGGELVALREQSDDDGKGGTVDRPADTRLTPDTTTPSGVRIAVDEDLAGLELTISENTTGADTAEIANALGETLATTDVSGLGPGDTFQIEHDLRAGEEYIVLASADATYDRGAYNEEPTWPYDGGEFRVVEGIWARDRSSTANFYAYTTLTALLDGDGGGDDPGDDDGTVDRPADTRLTPDTTTPSGVRIETQEALSGLELTISENTTGADTAEIADGLGNTLATTDVSGLGPGDTFQIEHDLAAGEEYIVLIGADGSYDRGAYNDEPTWPYDGGSFQVVEGIWGRDNSSTANFYAYTTLTALQ